MAERSKKRILIVEDESAIATGLKFNFEAEGYEAVVLGDGPSSLRYIDEHPQEIDLIVLDLMLPGMSGYEICQAVRERDQQMPIIVLSARTLSEDRAHAFDCGTDQYMTKPFALPELLARVRNLLHRKERMREAAAPQTGPEQFSFDGIDVNFRTFEIRRGGETFQLTTMEMQLLRYFIAHEGAVLARNRILKDVWGVDAEVTTRTIDNFVMRLRRYVETDPADPKHLLSVRGTGYRFVALPEG